MSMKQARICFQKLLTIEHGIFDKMTLTAKASTTKSNLGINRVKNEWNEIVNITGKNKIKVVPLTDQVDFLACQKIQPCQYLEILFKKSHGLHAKWCSRMWDLFSNASIMRKFEIWNKKEFLLNSCIHRTLLTGF